MHDMRTSLKELFHNSIKLEFDLPHSSIPKVTISNLPDDCLKSISSDTDIAKLIYNGIIEYSFEDREKKYPFKALHARALLNKLKYNPKASHKAQINYGFYGEVLLHLILLEVCGTETLVSRGHFYDPMENSETKGYDAYHLLETKDGNVELWFGEVKFHDDYYVVKEIVDKIDKSLSDDYFNHTVYCIDEQYDDVNPKSKLKEIIDEWRMEPGINIASELKKWNITLVYPMLLIFPDHSKPYEDIIKQCVDYINKRYASISYKTSFNTKLFFILLPISSTKNIKEQVLTWISQKEPLI